MTPDGLPPLPPLAPSSSLALQEALSRLCLDLADRVGLGLVSLGLFRATDELEVAAVSDRSPAEQARIGERSPSSEVLDLLARSEQWGALRFAPHDTGSGQSPRPPGDRLMLPLRDGDDLAGILSLDRPRDGQRPDPVRAEAIATPAIETGRTILALLARARIAHRVSLGELVGSFAREAGAHLDMAGLVTAARAVLRRGFDIEDVDVVVDDFPDLLEMGGDRRFVSLAERVARECWADGRVDVLSARSVSSPWLSSEEIAAVRTNLAERGVGSVLLAPVGAGPDCLGRIVMRRAVGQPQWSDEEAEAALAIGQDLGESVLTVRSYLREQQLGDYKGRLITAVSHELRQPISAMLGHLAVLAETVDELDPDDPTYAPLSSTTRRIGRAAERLSGIVTDLLSLSLVEGEESATPTTPVDLGEVVHGAVELLSIRALHGQVTLTESSDADVSVLGDAAELERLMINLVGNAVKYTAAGGTVVVSCTAEDDEAIVTITDTGIGISADDLAHLFEEFYRANDVEARRREGTGLGLAIVARIVERHHGRISAASVHGEGSTFTVTLPLAPLVPPR